MSSLKENSVIVPDVWSDKRIERRIETLEGRHNKQVGALRERIEELEYALDGIEKAFWGGVIGLIVLDLAILAIAIF
nr:MAG TPA: hemolysin [Caudoviricetes sp.]